MTAAVAATAAAVVMAAVVEGVPVVLVELRQQVMAVMVE
jgi:hypothetical protein